MLASNDLTGHHNFSHRKEKSNTWNTICRHNEEKNLAQTKNLPKQIGKNFQITNIKIFIEMKQNKMLNEKKKYLLISGGFCLFSDYCPGLQSLPDQFKKEKEKNIWIFFFIVFNCFTYYRLSTTVFGDTATMLFIHLYFIRANSVCKFF